MMTLFEGWMSMWTLFPLSDIQQRIIEEYGYHRPEGQYVQTAEMDTNPITVKGIWRRSG